MLSPFKLIRKIVNFLFKTISLFPKIIWWILFKKEQRRIGWYEKIPRNIASAFLYILAVILFLEGWARGCYASQGIPEDRYAYGLIYVGVGLMAFFMAHRISVRKVCEYCHLNKGVERVRRELIHEGYWVPVETSNGIKYEQENIYKYTYECKECGEGYTATGTEVRRK